MISLAAFPPVTCPLDAVSNLIKWRRPTEGRLPLQILKRHYTVEDQLRNNLKRAV